MQLLLLGWPEICNNKSKKKNCLFCTWYDGQVVYHNEKRKLVLKKITSFAATWSGGVYGWGITNENMFASKSLL